MTNVKDKKNPSQMQRRQKNGRAIMVVATIVASLVGPNVNHYSTNFSFQNQFLKIS